MLFNGIGIAIAVLASVTAWAMVVATLYFLRSRRVDRGESPAPPEVDSSVRVSILKPIKGLDDRLERNLEAFLNLQSISYEVLIGIGDRRDPAWPAIDRFLAAHPEAPMRVIFTDAPPDAHPKMSNLAGLEAQARGEILLVSDGNTCPPPDALERLVASFANPQIGLVAAPFLVRSPLTLGARLRSLRIGTAIVCSICGSYTLFKTPFVVGKWMAVRQQALADMGGFAALTGVMCADGLIYPKLRALGWRGAIVPQAIDVYLGPWSWRQAWSQQLRWSRHVRFVAPIETAVEFLWNGLFLGSLAIAFGWGGATIAACALGAAGLGVWCAYAIAYVSLGGAATDVLLLPIVDLQMLAIAVWAYASNEIQWRGRRFYIGPGGQLERSESLDPTG